MCRVMQVGLARDTSSPARARHLVTDTLRSWDMQRGQTDLQDTAVLLVDELVTNSVVHARSPAELVIAAANGTLEIGVTDHSKHLPQQPVPVAADRLSTHGRGIQLVDALSDEWGVVPLPTGKQTWFRLHTPAWPWTSACVCEGEDLPRVRLGSGGYALAMPEPWNLPPSP